MFRFLTSFLPVDKRRKGKCTNCGKCCELPFRCMFLKLDYKGKSYCSIYKYRFPQCRKYPRTEKEWITQSSCGYQFE